MQIADVPGIRRAQHSDQGAVERVVQLAYEPWVNVIGARPGPMDADYGSLIEAGSVFVTDAVDALVVLVPERDVLVIENVAVAPARQGHGLGRRLVSFAEATARASARSAVRLFTHGSMTSNIALYERLGFVTTRREPIDSGHLVHMRKSVG